MLMAANTTTAVPCTALPTAVLRASMFIAGWMMAFGGENWAKPRTVGKSSFPRRSSEWWLGLPGSRIYRSVGEDFAAERNPLGLESNRRALPADRRRQRHPRARQKGARHAPRPTTRRGNRLGRRTPAVRSDKNHSRRCPFSAGYTARGGAARTAMEGRRIGRG